MNQVESNEGQENSFEITEGPADAVPEKLRRREIEEAFTLLDISHAYEEDLKIFAQKLEEFREFKARLFPNSQN